MEARVFPLVGPHRRLMSDIADFPANSFGILAQPIDFSEELTQLDRFVGIHA